MAANGGEFAMYGFDRVTSADGEVTGSWYAVKAANNSDLVLTTGTTIPNSSDIDGDTIISSDTVYAPLIAVEVTSGTAYLYKNRP